MKHGIFFRSDNHIMQITTIIFSFKITRDFIYKRRVKHCWRSTIPVELFDVALAFLSLAFLPSVTFPSMTSTRRAPALCTSLVRAFCVWPLTATSSCACSAALIVWLSTASHDSMGPSHAILCQSGTSTR